jgi:hypothetical protein
MTGREVEDDVVLAGRDVLDYDEGGAWVCVDAVTRFELGEIAGAGTVGVVVA